MIASAVGPIARPHRIPRGAAAAAAGTNPTSGVHMPHTLLQARDDGPRAARPTCRVGWRAAEQVAAARMYAAHRVSSRPHLLPVWWRWEPALQRPKEPESATVQRGHGRHGRTRQLSRSRTRMAEAQLQALFEMQDKVGVCGEGSGGQSLGTFTDSHRL